MIEFRDNLTALHLGAMLARAMGHRISLSPGQSFAFSFSLDDWGISVDDFDMVVERERHMRGTNILVTFRRKVDGTTALATDMSRVLADSKKGTIRVGPRRGHGTIVSPPQAEQERLSLSPTCPPGEHDWDEQPGEPPFDACIKCGSVRH